MLSIQKHANELKIRFVYIFILFVLTFSVAYYYTEILIYIISNPFLQSKINRFHIIEKDFICTNIFEVFYTYILISFILALCLIIPVTMYILLDFFKIGLYSYEKKSLIQFLWLSFVLVLFTFIFIYVIVLPIFFSFFLNFEDITTTYYTVKFEQKLIDYIYLTIDLFLTFLILSQLPLIVFCCLALNLISFKVLKSNRRLFIFISFIVGCLLSTPELTTLLLISFPLIISFELVCWFFELKTVYHLKFF